MSNEKNVFLNNEDVSSFKRGLSFQRERFKSAKDGTGENNYDLMCDSLENLKSDLKSKIIGQGKSNIIKKVQDIINWYRTIEERYLQKTAEGTVLVLPKGMGNKTNQNLTVAYELLIREMDELDLL